MISRIRIEARASSMEEARHEIEIVLGHVQMAGYLEGLTPQSCSPSDEHFGRLYGHDQWSDLGMEFEGRMVLVFDPEPNPGGGLREYGYVVTRTDKDQIADPVMFGADEGKDVTAEVIVLGRLSPVTREHGWEGRGGLHVGMSAEEILSEIRRIDQVADVEIGYDRTMPDGSDGWRVTVTFKAEPGSVPMAASCGGLTLRDAAASAYEMSENPGTLRADRGSLPVGATTTIS